MFKSLIKYIKYRKLENIENIKCLININEIEQ
jgi:hypothetical protein